MQRETYSSKEHRERHNAAFILAQIKINGPLVVRTLLLEFSRKPQERFYWSVDSDWNLFSFSYAIITTALIM